MAGVEAAATTGRQAFRSLLAGPPRRSAALLLVALPLLAGCAAGGPAVPAEAAGERRQRPAASLMLEPPPGVRLVGLDGGGLTRVLGQPAFVRDERQAQFWRYDLGSCQLDLFLYQEGAAPGAPPRVLYLDAHPSGLTAATPHAEEACSALVARLRGAGAAARVALGPSGGGGGDDGLPPVEAP
jgi:hypothetical protein